MTPEELIDREVMRVLVARYAINGDRGRIAELAACFTEDGVLEFVGTRAVGREQIAEKLAHPPRPRVPRHSFSRHNLTSMLVELDGDTATGRSYFLVVCDAGPDHQGHYVDRYVRTADGWRIAHRQVRIDWQASSSLYPSMPLRAG